MDLSKGVETRASGEFLDELAIGRILGRETGETLPELRGANALKIDRDDHLGLGWET